MVDKETKEAVPVTAFLNGDQAGQGRHQGQRRRPRKVPLRPGDGPFGHAELRPVPSSDALHVEGAAREVRQDLWSDRTRLRKSHGGPHLRRRRQAPQGSLELPVHRRYVVPGSVHLRFSTHRAVRDSLRYPGRGNFLLRLQHGHRLAEYRRENAPVRHPQQVVRGAGTSLHLCRQQERQARDSTAHTLLLRDEDVHHGVQTDLDEIGIAKTARDEKRRTRDERRRSSRRRPRTSAWKRCTGKSSSKKTRAKSPDSFKSTSRTGTDHRPRPADIGGPFSIVPAFAEASAYAKATADKTAGRRAGSP